jgi:hypothetical protein
MCDLPGCGGDLLSLFFRSIRDDLGVAFGGRADGLGIRCHRRGRVSRGIIRRQCGHHERRRQAK